MASFTKLILYTYLKLDLSSICGTGLCGRWIFTSIYKNPQATRLRSCYQQLYVEQWPYFTCGFIGTLGHPKARKSYGGGGPVRGLFCRRYSSANSISGSSCADLEGLLKANKNNKELTNHKLIHVIANTDTLILAYEFIKSNPGNMTRGLTPTTLDKIDLKWFENASKKLRAGKYKFTPARRVFIPKPGEMKKKTRPLAISSSRDKIIQKAILLILEAIFEANFLDFSHGSRPKKDTHTALKYIKYNFKECKWCIEADIESNFPNINHKILLNLLRKRISCSKFLNLIKKSLKTGYVENKKFFESNIGLFQGNIISPILNNIYLHELDLFMLKLKKSFDLGKQRRKNHVYRKFSYLMEKAEGDALTIKNLRKQRSKISSKDPFDPKFKRLNYVRYEDDFVVGVIGSRAETVSLKEKIKSFLKSKLKLTLSPSKTLITNFSKQYIFFLGTLIKGTWEKEKRQVVVKKNGISRKVRITSRTVLKAPIKLLFQKATLNKFFKKRNESFVPTYVGRLVNFDHADILRYYNSIIRGILNYYSFVNNHKSLGSLIHGLKFSCARTFAVKYKLRHASKVFKKFGSKLKESPDSKIELYIPKTFKALKNFKVSVEDPEEIIFSNWNKKLTKSNLFKQCVICGESKKVEMHHIRRVRDLKSKLKKKKTDFFLAQMVAINRKQVPLCKKHHQALHKNALTQKERELLKNNTQLLKKGTK